MTGRVEQWAQHRGVRQRSDHNDDLAPSPPRSIQATLGDRGGDLRKENEDAVEQGPDRDAERDRVHGALSSRHGVVATAGVDKHHCRDRAAEHHQAVAADAAAEVCEHRVRREDGAADQTGRVLSKLTNRGLAAQVSLSTAKATADATGNFTIYGVGPGEQVQVAADGYTTTGFDVPSNRVLSAVLYPTVSTELAYDLPGIETLWRDFTASWGPGGRAGSAASWAFVLAHDYPRMDANCVKAAALFSANAARGYTETYTLDVASVRRFNNWVVSFGGVVNDIPFGRTYVMNLTNGFSDGTASETHEVHVALYNGQPRMFVDCSADGHTRIGPG